LLGLISLPATWLLGACGHGSAFTIAAVKEKASSPELP